MPASGDMWRMIRMTLNRRSIIDAHQPGTSSSLGARAGGFACRRTIPKPVSTQAHGLTSRLVELYTLLAFPNDWPVFTGNSPYWTPWNQHPGDRRRMGQMLQLHMTSPIYGGAHLENLTDYIVKTRPT